MLKFLFKVPYGNASRHQMAAPLQLKPALRAQQSQQGVVPLVLGGTAIPKPIDSVLVEHETKDDQRI